MIVDVRVGRELKQTLHRLQGVRREYCGQVKAVRNGQQQQVNVAGHYSHVT